MSNVLKYRGSARGCNNYGKYFSETLYNTTPNALLFLLVVATAITIIPLTRASDLIK